MLSLKQQKFCEYYVELGNATEAAKRAGYSEKTAYSQGQRMLKNVETRNFIDSLIKRYKSDKTASAEEVLEFFAAVMRDKSEAMKNRLKAAENLAKRYGLNKNSSSESNNDNDATAINFIFTDTSAGNENE